MNTKIGITILAVACIGFAVALVAVKRQADAQQKDSANTIVDFSNQIDKANIHIEDLSQANLTLNNDLATNRQVSLALSNQLVEAATTLATTAVSLQGAEQQITNLNDRITGLETQNQELDRRATSLSNTIAALDEQISATRAKLASSETNNAFLDRELKRQIAERAELERKFNDLAQVRAQVRKLRDDLLIARRLEWMREGVDPTKPLKGGQLLMQRPPPIASTAPAAGSPAYNLNVEVGSDGSVHVTPSSTNALAPAGTPSH
jgi:predicted RNase H-like nuclease (RuvC/YqgF family)